MRRRCSPAAQGHDFDRYYARGIRVCEEWLNDFPAFERWAIANGWDKALTLDRIDGDKGYFPENCRWVDMATNCKNKVFTEKYISSRRAAGLARKNISNKPVMCIETGAVYESGRAAGRTLGMALCAVSAAIRNERPTHGKNWKFV
jgi:hypothetical protein